MGGPRASAGRARDLRLWWSQRLQGLWHTRTNPLYSPSEWGASGTFTPPVERGASGTFILTTSGRKAAFCARSQKSQILRQPCRRAARPGSSSRRRSPTSPRSLANQNACKIPQRRLGAPGQLQGGLGGVGSGQRGAREAHSKETGQAEGSVEGGAKKAPSRPRPRPELLSPRAPTADSAWSRGFCHGSTLCLVRV